MERYETHHAAGGFEVIDTKTLTSVFGSFSRDLPTAVKLADGLNSCYRSFLRSQRKIVNGGLPARN